jgi:hypothetical protein
VAETQIAAGELGCENGAAASVMETVVWLVRLGVADVDD